MKYLLPATIVVAFSVSGCRQQTLADHIYYNAKIWTGDTAQPRVTAIAMKDSMILYTGNDYQAFTGKNTVLTDLQGKMITPGLIDNHTHFLGGGYALASVKLRDAKTPQDFIRILKMYSSSLTDDRWIQGGDWDHEAWGGALPRKEWIDSVTGNHPLFVNRYDGHMVLVNSLALKAAGITRETPDPPGGTIVRDLLTGDPTGILKDEAMGLMNKAIPQPSAAELEESLERGVNYAFEHGVTQVHDMGSYGGWTDLAAYRKAQANGKLGLRIYAFVPLATWKQLDSFVKQNGRGNDILRWGGLKGFVDGSLGSTTAWFYHPYLDNPSTGLQVTDTNNLRKWITEADSAGLQIATHAIGDHANDFILSVYQQAEEKNGKKDRRFRVEHAQHLTDDAILKFGRLNVIASMQPYHAIDDGRWAYKRLDTGRLKGTYAFKRLEDAGAWVTFGSDWTVAPMQPLLGIYAAVTRRTLDDKNPQGWYPDQKLTVEQALNNYTVHNAYAGYQENKLGKLKAGYLADFVVLDADLFQIPPEKIKDVKVLLTVVNGKTVYKAADQQ